MNTAPIPVSLNPNQKNDLQDQLQAYIANIRDTTGVPGVSIAMNIKDAEMMASVGTLSIENNTPMTKDTHFQLGCTTKLLTALVVAELIEAGKLHPDDPIEKYLKELRGTEKGKNIQIWHLLSHTSGYSGLNISDPRVAYYYTWTKFVEFLNITPQLFNPGTVFSYDNSEYVLLGEIIKKVTGSDILDLYQEMIIGPLRIGTGSIRLGQRGNKSYVVDHIFNADTMKYEAIKPIPFGEFWKASLNTLTMSFKDISQLAATLCGINKVPSGISENALKFIQKQVIKIPSTFGSSRHEHIPVTFGVGCALYRGWLYGINGSARGQTCGFRFDVHNKISLVMGINVWAPFIRDSAINFLFNQFRQKPIEPIPEKSFQGKLDDLTGSYLGTHGTEIVVTCEDGQIIFTLKNLDSTPLKYTMQKDEENILRVVSDMQHYSLGFFHEPESGFDGLMLGMSAYRKQ